MSDVILHTSEEPLTLEQSQELVKTLREIVAKQRTEIERLNAALQRQARANSDYVPYPESNYDR